MFKRSRKKIIGSITGSLVALFAVTLVVIYLTNLASQRRESREALDMYVARYSLEQQPEMGEADRPEPEDPGAGMPEMQDPEPEKPEPGDAGTDSQEPEDPETDKPEMKPPEMKAPERNDPPPAPPDDERRQHAFLLSTYYAVAFSPTGEVLSVNNGDNGMQSEEELIETAGKILESGRADGDLGTLSYRVEERDEYTVVAMIDNTLSDSHLKDLMLQMIIIGSIAIVVLILISVLLAKAIVRPLEENDRKQKAFISDAGHELKTPIAVISTNLELMKKQPENKEWLENIEYENQKMSALVMHLLELSRAEKTEIVKETVDLSRLVTGEVLAFDSLAFEAGKSILSEVEPEIRISGNQTTLQQLVSILLDNALCYGTGEEILLSLKKERHTAVLTVANEAPFMSEEEISHLFDRLYRKEEARTDQGGHFGLGLPIAKAVAVSHGAALDAAWKDGKITFRAVFQKE